MPSLTTLFLTTVARLPRKTYRRFSRIHLKPSAALGAVLLSSSLSLQGCAILLGNVKPVTDRADGLSFTDLSEQDPDWTKREEESSSLEASDVSFQSRRTLSTISITSTCRGSIGETDQTLASMTDTLLLGIQETERAEEHLTVSGQPALKTTIKGMLQSRTIQIQTIVVKKDDCLYDFMYVARPERFNEQLKTFESFINEIKLK